MLLTSSFCASPLLLPVSVWLMCHSTPCMSQHLQWCGTLNHGAVSHGVVTHSWCSYPLMVWQFVPQHPHSCHSTPQRDAPVTVVVTLLIRGHIFMPMKIIAWVAAECDLEHSSLPVPPRGKTLHHVRELRAGTWQQCLHSVVLTPEHHKTDWSL